MGLDAQLVQLLNCESKDVKPQQCNALSYLPAGPDANFDGEEGDADMYAVCTIKTASLQLNPTDPGTLANESAKDVVIVSVMCCTREG